MNKRRVVVVAVLASALLMLGGVVLVWDLSAPNDAPRVTEANCNRIKPGMMVAEVEEILGQMGNEYPLNPAYAALNLQVLYWRVCEKNPDHVDVMFSNGRVVGKASWLQVGRQESMSKKISRWLHLW
jgi:hypothetical protein